MHHGSTHSISLATCIGCYDNYTSRIGRACDEPPIPTSVALTSILKQFKTQHKPLCHESSAGLTMTQKEDSKINSISMKGKRAPSSTPDSDDKKYKMVPPDGGWGWVIVLAASICTVRSRPLYSFGRSCYSLVQSPAAVFSLLYKDTMNDLQLTATNITVILNTYMGLLLIFGAGGAMIYMSTQVALGMYFTERRGQAMGLTMTVTGLSLIVAPPITSHLMRVFGARGTGLLQAALSLNGLVGASLLRPVEWYMKKVGHETEEQQQTTHGQDGGSRVNESKIKISEDKSYVPVRLEEAGEKSEIKLEISENGKEQVENELNLGSKENARIREEARIRWYGRNEDGSGDDSKKINYVGKIETARETKEEVRGTDSCKCASERRRVEESTGVIPSILRQYLFHSRDDVNINQSRGVKTKHLEKEGALSRLVQLLDVHLLKDNTFLVLVVGISLAASAEYTFTFLVPLILVDFNFSLDETAYVMSLIATGDLLTRFLSPFFADWFKMDARSMYVLGLLTVVASRSVILFRTEFHAMMAVGLFLGMGKGVRTVYMNLVVPAYVPMDKIASALAFQNLGIGVITLLISPLIGGGCVSLGLGPRLEAVPSMLRDVSGNYTPSVVILNLSTLLVIFVLVGDRAFARRKQRSTAPQAK
uniref:Major facilitator superfamily (MFS) profile domain-containing protein n=1 Tax=Timema monikensis TaxID=170555 RepID=A0A7R9E6M4_9NEOP|nr:unnamed protein product [Timema monikensis]